MDEKGALFRDLFEINDELIRVLRVGKRFGREEGNDMIGDDFYGLVCKVISLHTHGRPPRVRGKNDRKNRKRKEKKKN